MSRQVKSHLSLGFTPEQIAVRMKLESFNGTISCQTIYGLIKKTPWRHSEGVEACARLMPNRVDIDERPDCVDLKEKVGHWEGIPFTAKMGIL
ncbi:MAG: hypothetical protein KAG53_01435 [Endozoicomonadaceae bacterium]|nr:hypothetical protein [Endozoicomonadaceae bacterium]